MVRIGLVGIGFMGMIHYLAAQKLGGAQVVAIHSHDARKLAGDWTGIQENGADVVVRGADEDANRALAFFISEVASRLATPFTRLRT